MSWRHAVRGDEVRVTSPTMLLIDLKTPMGLFLGAPGGGEVNCIRPPVPLPLVSFAALGPHDAHSGLQQS